MAVTEMESREYIENAIRRVEAGHVLPGSYIAGVFGKSACLYETIMRSKLQGMLNGFGVDYETSIRLHIKGTPPFRKLTLGMVAFCLKLLDQPPLDCLRRAVPVGTDRNTFCDRIGSINDKWVGVKHKGQEIAGTEAVSHLKMMVLTINTADHIGYKRRSNNRPHGAA
jgi:hypothetical protein